MDGVRLNTSCMALGFKMKVQEAVLMRQRVLGGSSWKPRPCVPADSSPENGSDSCVLCCRPPLKAGCRPMAEDSQEERPATDQPCLELDREDINRLKEIMRTLAASGKLFPWSSNQALTLIGSPSHPPKHDGSTSTRR